MYAALWRRLPGATPAKTVTATLLLAGLLAALWFGVFPWAASHLPIDGGAVTG